MTKRVEQQLNKFRYKNQPLRLTLGALVLTGLCSFLIVIATFTQFDFNHFILPFDAFSYVDANFKNPAVMAHFIKHYRYIPQIPAIIFIAVLLGRRFGIASVLIYILTGLFLAPVFALGGGLEYVFQYGFGYILAYIPAVFFAGSILRSGLTYINMAQATLVSVVTIHLFGILYMLFIATLQKENSAMILGWISAQSGVKILYDLLFGFLAMILAKFTKKILWVAIG
ncbi:MAG: biotin transporter BioY [Candidatus Gastranaerophilales bacterium]|nr:biotin transporter BioY [Candidatus Gastranaerophilales bacterium]